MTFSTYTQRMVAGAVRNGDWEKWSPEQRKEFALKTEQLVQAARLATTIGESAVCVDVEGTNVVFPSAPAKKQPESKAAKEVKPTDVKVTKDEPKSKDEDKSKDESKSSETKESKETKTTDKAQTKTAKAEELMKDCVKSGSKTEAMAKELIKKGSVSENDKNTLVKTMKEEVIKDMNPKHGFEKKSVEALVDAFADEFSDALNKKDEVKPEAKKTSDEALMKELGRNAMHMTWAALRAAGVAGEKVKDYTKGFIDTFMEKSETTLDKLYDGAFIRASKSKEIVDGPRPEPVTDAEKTSMDQSVPSDAMEAELDAVTEPNVVPFSGIQRIPEVKAAATATDITGKFLKDPKPVPTQVSVAEANPMSKQSVQQATVPQQANVMVPIRPTVNIPLPSNWTQLNAEQKCEHYYGLIQSGALPQIMDPVPQFDMGGKAAMLKEHIALIPSTDANRKMHPIQIIGLLQLLTGSKLVAKMSQLQAEDPVNNPHLSEVKVAEYASNKANEFDMAFTMNCVDKNWIILILFNSVPEFRDGMWVFNSSIEKIHPKRKDKRHGKQSPAEANRQLTGLGIAYANQQAQQNA